MQKIVLATVVALLFAGQANAQNIERACLQSDRQAKSRALCGCIQKAADLMLSESDQELAVMFYREPDLAQEIRQSDRRAHERFWDRYKVYASTATKYCR